MIWRDREAWIGAVTSDEGSRTLSGGVTDLIGLVGRASRGSSRCCTNRSARYDPDEGPRVLM